MNGPTMNGSLDQSRRCVFKGGLAEEVIECRKHKRGILPLSSGGFQRSPPRKFLNFGRFYVRFNGVLCVLDEISVVFGHNLLLEKIFLVKRETECCTKLFSDNYVFFLKSMFL